MTDNHCAVLAGRVSHLKTITILGWPNKMR
jgi:hypothetical protein